MINIPDVTLLAISCDRIEGSIQALLKSSEKINFGAIKFVSHERPKNLPENIQYEYCPKINNMYEYDYYAFKEFGKHTQTSHMLLVQDHGYVINPELWDSSWLAFSYIGAPWPERPDFMSLSSWVMVRVGNGGFSLRSKELMDLPKKLDLPLVADRGYTADDGQICSFYRKTFLENGIRYAPIEVAAKFSFENHVPENKDITKTFGFHRYQK